MIVLSLPLTILTFLMSMVMIYTTRKLGSRSSKFFYAQQTNLGNMNGFVEEMLTGQKVVKIFCHEDEAVDQFQQLNENQAALRNAMHGTAASLDEVREAAQEIA